MNEGLAAFYDRLIRLMVMPVAAPDAPGIQSNFFPVNNPPAIFIYIGAPDASEMAGVRAQLPPKTFLFYLFGSGIPDHEAVLQQSVSPGERTCVCPISPNSLFVEKIGLLVAVSAERTVRLVVGQGNEAKYAAELASIRKAIEAAQENSTQDAIRGLIRLRCSVWNLPGIWKSQSYTLNPVGPEVSAVVCGAGPSLAGQMPLLKSIAAKVLVIAVGHAVPSLLKAGITPHIVVESDFMSWRNWPADVKLDSILVAGTDVAPGVAARFEKTQWFYGSSRPFSVAMAHWGLSLLPLQLGRTVSISAFDLALRMGCGTVALIGQDLCIGAAGVSHVDGEKVPPGDALTSIPGNEGVPVSTTDNLLGLKRDIEDFLGSAAARHLSTHFINCTAGGALIQGVARSSFEAFCEKIDRVEVLPAGWFSDKPTCGPDMAGVRELEQAMATYASLADRLVTVCKRLIKHLNDLSVDFDVIRQDQARLQELMSREQAARSGAVVSEWLNVMLSNVDDLMKQTPGMISNDPDPVVQLTFLLARFRLVGDLANDLHSDLRAVGTRLRAQFNLPGSKRIPAVNLDAVPYVFESFRRHALSTIRGGNEELASYLERSRPVEVGHRFRITWMNQVVPYVQVRMEDGRWQPLSSFLAMYQDAVRDIQEMERSLQFDVQRQGLIMVGGGNWIHAMVFAKKFPGAEVMVVDPWLDLFNHLIERGCFLHSLSPRGLVIAADERVGDWRALCQSRVQEWTQAGRMPVLYSPPGCCLVPEIVTLKKEIEALL